MKKIDGKEYYTFVGLINRMDACRNNKCFSKDIPEEVEFKGHTYHLSADMNTYYHNDTINIAKSAASYYGTDLSKYLTEFDFIVAPKETVKVTRSESMLIRYMNMFSNKTSTYVSIEHGDLGGGFRALYLWDDDGVANSVDVTENTFCNFKSGVKYRIRDLEVMDE